MSANNYQTIPLLYKDTLTGGTCSIRVVTNQTKYSKPFNITHLDSVHGLSLHYVGYRWGGAMTVQLQQTLNGNAGPWADIGASYDLASGGVSEANPATLDEIHTHIPAAGTTFLPALRLKVTTAVAGTGVVVEDLFRTVRGLK